MKDVEHGNPRSAGRFFGPIGVRVSSVAPAERRAPGASLGGRWRRSERLVRPAP